jgi:hypothetical protein
MPEERREWGAAMLAELDQAQSPLERWRFALGCTGVALLPPRRTGMLQSIVNRPRAAALAGLLLALPISLILTIAAFQIEPFERLLKAWSTQADGRQTVSSFITLLASFLLLPVASLVTLAPVVRGVRAGQKLCASPLNVSMGVLMLAVFLGILGAVFIDQLPCFLGEPNCD